MRTKSRIKQVEDINNTKLKLENPKNEVWQFFLSQSATEALLCLVFTAVIFVAHTDYLDGHWSGYTGQVGVHKKTHQ